CRAARLHAAAHARYRTDAPIRALAGVAQRSVALKSRRVDGHDADDGLARDVTTAALGVAGLRDTSREHGRRVALSRRRSRSHSAGERRAHSPPDAAPNPP